MGYLPGGFPAVGKGLGGLPNRKEGGGKDSFIDVMKRSFDEGYFDQTGSYVGESSSSPSSVYRRGGVGVMDDGFIIRRGYFAHVFSDRFMGGLRSDARAVQMIRSKGDWIFSGSAMYKLVDGYPVFQYLLKSSLIYSAVDMTSDGYLFLVSSSTGKYDYLVVLDPYGNVVDSVRFYDLSEDTDIDVVCVEDDGTFMLDNNNTTNRATYFGSYNTTIKKITTLDPVARASSASHGHLAYSKDQFGKLHVICRDRLSIQTIVGSRLREDRYIYLPHTFSIPDHCSIRVNTNDNTVVVYVSYLSSGTSTCGYIKYSYTETSAQIIESKFYSGSSTQSGFYQYLYINEKHILATNLNRAFVTKEEVLPDYGYAKLSSGGLVEGANFTGSDAYLDNHDSSNVSSRTLDYNYTDVVLDPSPSAMYSTYTFQYEIRRAYSLYAVRPATRDWEESYPESEHILERYDYVKWRDIK